jgi:hypothetical protein
MKMTQQQIYVSEENITRIKRIIERLQEASPFVAVTKKCVEERINEDHMRPKVSYRMIGRVFRILVDKGILVKASHGRYLSAEFYKIRIKKLKESYEGLEQLTAHYLDALDYCDSEEDWKLLEAFFTKMRDNKYAKERRECQEDYNALIDEVLQEEKASKDRRV